MPGGQNAGSVNPGGRARQKMARIKPALEEDTVEVLRAIAQGPKTQPIFDRANTTLAAATASVYSQSYRTPQPIFRMVILTPRSLITTHLFPQRAVGAPKLFLEFGNSAILLWM